MSTYIILPLKFTAPVHFGDASGGGGLDAGGHLFQRPLQ